MTAPRAIDDVQDLALGNPWSETEKGASAQIGKLVSESRARRDLFALVRAIVGDHTARRADFCGCCSARSAVSVTPEDCQCLCPTSMRSNSTSCRPNTRNSKLR